jgi:peptidoglycan hydrolase-like protein with peptidoglycan-binding domain
MLKLGSKGSAVVALQKELAAAGDSPGTIDGVFGAHTLAAVKKYQAQHHLAVDGLVGPKTLHALATDGFTPGKPAPKPQPTPAPKPGPVTPPSGSTGSAKIDKLLNEARSHIGFHEGAGNANPFSKAMGRPNEAWCADFVSYCAKKAGFTANNAGAQHFADILKARGGWKGRSNPQPGDAVTFRWDGTHGFADHIGLVEKVFQKGGQTYIQTIEGNSGDQVRRKTYLASSSVINGFGKLS